ncbi:MAG: 3-hydroxybutyryl-CoA dehydrogenase [Acidimicrobiales bacterium]|nr:MAG: 3-hydroxybutyryl-CoA dehydrogenase [Acidimicrobiales bacterium]
MPQTLMVLGAGLMGAGIAQVAAETGWRVTLYDTDPQAPPRARAVIERSLAARVRKHQCSSAHAAAALDRVKFGESLDAASAANVLVEAVFEDVDIKFQLFAELDRIAAPHALLCSNTSAIPITRLAAATSRPESVVGTHFFSPVPMMELCELVAGEQTSESTLGKATDFVESLGKTAVVVRRDVPGFITTRLITALVLEAARLVEAGVASAADIDTACRLGFGHRMGPLATCDLIGADVLVNAAKVMYAEAESDVFDVPELLARMVADGKLGRKTGGGFYPHSPS